MSDKSKKEAERAKEQAKNYYDRAEQANQQARKEEAERYKAQDIASKVEAMSERSKMTYKTLFVGNIVFTVIVAFFVAYGKRGVFAEMVKWFPARWENIKNVFTWFIRLYNGSVNLMIDKWSLSAVWCYIIASIVGIILLILVFLGCLLVYIKIADLAWDIKREYSEPLLKGVISADIVIGMFYIVLFFSDQLKMIRSLNIFSVWLILSIIGCVIWNFPEIKRGILEN